MRRKGFTIKHSVNDGFTLMEVLLAIGFFAIISASFYPILGWLVAKSKIYEYDVEASLVLQEGMEAGYNVLVNSWDSNWLTYPPGEYHPAVDTSGPEDVWALLSGGQTGIEARYDRTITISQVCRDLNTGDQIEGGCPPTAAIDNNSKLVTTKVNWKEPGRSRELQAKLLVTYLGD